MTLYKGEKQYYIKKMKKPKTRIYIKKEISSNLLIYIKDKQHHFLKNVMRVQVSDTIRIFDGITGEWNSKVLSVNRDSIVLRVIEKIKSKVQASDIWLIFAPIKQFRMNIAIQKATELGVSKAIPCLTEYTDIKSVNIKNLQLNAIEAVEQSERLDIPKIEEPILLVSLLNSWPEDRYLVYFDEKHNQEKSIIESLLPLKNNNNKLAVLIGPEGGFSDSERELITKHKNVLVVSLRNRLLRSDTAITVALFCVQELAC